MKDCLFCKIIAHDEIPSTKVYENDSVYAFLDISPVNLGHTLVVPKKHYKNVYETPDEALAEMMSVAKKIATAIKSELKADGVNIIMNNDKTAGQIIFHSHLHVVPRYEGDGFVHWSNKKVHDKSEVVAVEQTLRAKLR